MRALQCLIFPLVALVVGCNTSNSHSVMVDVDSSAWYKPAEVALEVYDTTSVVSLDVALRYSSSLESDSLELHITTIAPDSVRWSEYFTVALPQCDGQIINYDAPYRNAVKWQMEGEYKFCITPKRVYKGVMAIGINTNI